MRDYYLSVITCQRTGVTADLLRAVLLFFSWVYQGMVVFFRFFYRSGILKPADLGRPVISVGNITWGGVGKTPLVIWLTEYLVRNGRKPVILTRGYMPRQSVSGTGAGAHSDEADLLRGVLNGVPVVVNKNRVRGALSVPDGYFHDVFILDDGFQQWRVKRDIDIVAIDATNPFGRGHVLPRGILREPLSALKTADMFIITKSDLAPQAVSSIKQTLKRRNPSAVIAQAVHAPVSLKDLSSGQVLPLNYLMGRQIILACAVGDPQSFAVMARGLGACIKDHAVYPDHYAYGQKDAQYLNTLAATSGIHDIVITAKDGVKLSAWRNSFSADCRLLVMNIQIVIKENEQEILDQIQSLFAA